MLDHEKLYKIVEDEVREHFIETYGKYFKADISHEFWHAFIEMHVATMRAIAANHTARVLDELRKEASRIKQCL